MVAPLCGRGELLLLLLGVPVAETMTSFLQMLLMIRCDRPRRVGPCRLSGSEVLQLCIAVVQQQQSPGWLAMPGKGVHPVMLLLLRFSAGADWQSGAHAA